MASPNRTDYDSDEYYYDEETDTLYSYDEHGTNYDGDGSVSGHSKDY